jgi:hypothetical protein
MGGSSFAPRRGVRCFLDLSSFFTRGRAPRLEDPLEAGRQRAVVGVDIDDILAVDHARTHLLVLHEHHQMQVLLL